MRLHVLTTIVLTPRQKILASVSYLSLALMVAPSIQAVFLLPLAEKGTATHPAFCLEDPMDCISMRPQ